MTANSQALANPQKTLLIVWVFNLLLVGVELMLPHLRGRESFLPEGELLRTVLWGVAVIEVGVVLWWGNRLLDKEAILRRSRELVLLNTPEGDQPSLEEGVSTLVSYYLSRKVVTFALSQTVAIYGLILALVGPYVWDQLGLTLVSGALLGYHYPSTKFFDELITEQKRR